MHQLTGRVFRTLAAAILAGAAIQVLSCADRGPTGPSLVTYALTGVVRSTTTQPIADVTVEVAGYRADGTAMSAATSTDANGAYTVTGLQGATSIHLTRTGFYPRTSALLLNRDITLDFVLEAAPPLALEGADLALGLTVLGIIGPADQRCDLQWDRNAPCRHYGFTAPDSRTYDLNVRSPVCQDALELHLFDGATRIAYAADRKNPSLAQNLVGGRSYQIRLMAYYRCDWFELTVK